MFPPDNSDESDGRRKMGRVAWEFSYKERGAEGSDNMRVMLINIFWQQYSDIDRYLLKTLQWCWSISSENIVSIFSVCYTVINYLLSIFVYMIWTVTALMMMQMSEEEIEQIFKEIEK